MLRGVGYMPKARTLTARQARFVEEYLIDLNATQAAIRAGYSEKTAREIAAQNLTKLNIQAAMLNDAPFLEGRSTYGWALSFK